MLHDGQLITEQLAIALYLTDAFPEAGLAQPVGTAERASYLTWHAFFAGEADPIYNTRLLYGSSLDPMTLRDHRRVVGRVEAALRAGPFLMGNAITVADILMSGPFEWDPQMAPDSGRIREWLQRLADRPEAKRAAEKDERLAESME